MSEHKCKRCDNLNVIIKRFPLPDLFCRENLSGVKMTKRRLKNSLDLTLFNVSRCAVALRNQVDEVIERLTQDPTHRYVGHHFANDIIAGANSLVSQLRKLELIEGIESDINNHYLKDK